jgi:hypothetical protein
MLNADVASQSGDADPGTNARTNAGKDAALDAAGDSSSTPASVQDAAGGTDAAAALDATTPDAAVEASSMSAPAQDAAGATDAHVAVDATNLDAALPDPPPHACDADAESEAGLCPPPPSVCADMYSLVYYDNGQCVSGQCVWEKRSMSCPLLCEYGVCNAMTTIQ